MGKKEISKKHYQKPKVNQVKLVMDDAVLTACKTSAVDSNGKNGSGCDIVKCKYPPYGS